LKELAVFWLFSNLLRNRRPLMLELPKISRGVVYVAQ
jgi:hypothetical protein